MENCIPIIILNANSVSFLLTTAEADFFPGVRRPYLIMPDPTPPATFSITRDFVMQHWMFEVNSN
jgi:hypothetical protein